MSLIKTMAEIAEPRKKTISQVALNYIILKGAISIPGARTEQQLLDNLGAMDGDLFQWKFLCLSKKLRNLDLDLMALDSSVLMKNLSGMVQKNSV